MIPAKKTKKEEAQPLATVETSSPSLSTPIIEEDNNKVNASKKNKKSFEKNAGGLTMMSTVNDLSIKIYEEQLTVTLDEFKEIVQNIDPKQYYVFSIVHDKDLDGDEIYEPAYKKRHIHILVVRQGKDADGRPDRRKVSTILNMLNIVFRPGLDDLIWRKRGVERIKKLANAVAYLTHETEEAIRDGKELYDRCEIFSNLAVNEIDQLRDGYVKVTNAKNKISINEQMEIKNNCELFGRNGQKTYDELYCEMPFVAQKSAQLQQLFMRSYNKGVEQRMMEHSEVLRLCVFIQGEHNQGKTYAAKHAFDNMGVNIYEVSEGSGTGKMDNLREDHDVIIADDATFKTILDMADNKVCKAYRRNGLNPWWCGRYLIVTSNLDFDSWVKKCGVDKDHLEAARSRFYICQIIEEDGEKWLECLSVSDRGQPEDQERRRDMFLEFQTRFNDIIGHYKPDARKVDYSAVLGPSAAPGAVSSDKVNTDWFGAKEDDNGQLTLPDLEEERMKATCLDNVLINVSAIGKLDIGDDAKYRMVEKCIAYFMVNPYGPSIDEEPYELPF